MSHDQKSKITRLLNEANQRPEAAEELLSLVYDQLRSIATARMRSERSDHTLQATVLVHDAFLKMMGSDRVDWVERGQFFRYAADAMRRILIDHARSNRAEKRGGGRQRLPLDVVDLAANHDPGDILALEDGLKVFEAEDTRAAEVVKLRFFAGLSVEDTASALDISERTVMRETAFARARLTELLEKSGHD